MTQRIRPESIRLESTTHCQLRCPSCPTAKGVIKERIGNGFLKFDDFRRLIDENPHVTHVELSNWGELFLNPDLLEMMEYAYQESVELTASNGTNLNTVSPQVLEGLVKFKFRHMTCSIDGASQQTYEKYRVRGDFDQVIRNIETINRHKKEFRSKFPVLRWQFIAFDHNAHEIQAARELARRLGMHFFLKLSWDEGLAPSANQEIARLETPGGVVNEREFSEENETGYLQRSICGQLWREPQVNWDGEVLGCCVNTWQSFGNVFDSTLLETLQNERMTYARRMLMGRAEPRDDIACTTCDHYKAMAARADWLTPDPVDNSFKARLTRLLGRKGVWLTNRSRRLARWQRKFDGA